LPPDARPGSERDHRLAPVAGSFAHAAALAVRMVLFEIA
jgi:hypothetical protein